MTREAVIAALRAFRPELQSVGIDKLYLFGSMARNDPKSNDIDLLYEAYDMAALDFFGLAGAENRLEEKFGKPVELVSRRNLHRRIRDRIEAEMVEIY